ncbi:MAG TPA: LamG domain-containing protein [Kofleriaceae bacterium]|nr:LamG domain-containing protein [Kofleriaceae bacterium]
MTKVGLRWLLVFVPCACGRIGFDASCAVPEPVDESCVAMTTRFTASYAGGGVRFALDEITADGETHDADSKYTAQCTGMCPVSAEGAQGMGRGLKFSNQQLRITGLPGLDGSTGYTVAVWARLDTLPGAMNPLETRYSCAVSMPNSTAMPSPPEDDGNSFALCVEPSGRAYVFSTSSTRADALIPVDGFGVTGTDEWHHIAATWDAACKTQVLYFDGCRVNVRTGIEIQFDPADVFVGADNFGTHDARPTYFWNGVLDDLLIYDRPLGDAEIRGLVGK